MTWAWFMQFWHKEPDVSGLGRLTRYGFFILEALSTGPKHGIGIVEYVRSRLRRAADPRPALRGIGPA